jgi:hypothetical protein
MIAQSSISGAIPLVDIMDSEARLQLEDLNLQISFDYAFITDPPLLADIGSATIGLSGIEFGAKFNTTLAENIFEIGLIDLALDFVDPTHLVSFEGINDFSEVITNVVNTFGAIFRNRLSSMMNQ